MTARYLINNLDDLKDVVGTIHNLVKQNSREEDFCHVMKQIPVDFIALGQNLKSFVVSIELPEEHRK
jgi:hypothetical protein